MARANLRPVGANEKPAAQPPKTLAAAVELDRRSLLVRSRLQIAQVVDAGVPAHALGRLIAEMNDLDAEIRRLDAAELEESRDAAHVPDEAFDAEAI